MIYEINKFNGGISDYTDRGIPGAFKFGQNLNLHKLNDSLFCNQDLKEEGVGVISDLIKFFVKSSVDGLLYGFGSTGKIYKRDNNGNYTLVYTDPDGEIRGAEEAPQNDKTVSFIWATATKLKRKPMPGAGNWSDVSTVATNLADVPYHTMKQVNGNVMICNGEKLAMWAYDGSFTNEALDLIPGNISKTLVERKGRTIIGCYQKSDPDSGINSAIDGEFPFIQVGNKGYIYLADGVSSIPIKQFPGGGKTNPSSVCNLIQQPEVFEWEEEALSWIDKQEVGNFALFGVYGAEKNFYNGIYSLGRLTKNRPLILNLEYSLKDVQEIGALTSLNENIIVSYRKNPSMYGVRSIDFSKKAIANYQGLELKAKPKGFGEKTFWDIAEILLAPLPSGCKIFFNYRLNKSGNFIPATTIEGRTSYDKTGGTKALFSIKQEAEIFEPEVILGPNGNLSPEVFRIRIYFH